MCSKHYSFYILSYSRSPQTNPSFIGCLEAMQNKTIFTTQLIMYALHRVSLILNFYSGASSRIGMQVCREGMYAIGSIDKTRLSVVNRELLENTPTRTFTRAFIKGALYHSAAYAKASETTTCVTLKISMVIDLG